MEEMLGESRRLGRPRTRPPVRRVTLELDEALLQRVEEYTLYTGASLRTVTEMGLGLLLERLDAERSTR